MSTKILEVYQGLQFDRVLQIVNVDESESVNVFTSDSVPAATIWQGQNQAVLAAPSVIWYTGNPAFSQTGYLEGQVALSIGGSLTQNLDPAGEYYLLVTVATGGLTSAVWEGRVKILATPGTTSPAPPDLATYDYVESFLTVLNLSDTQRDFLPYMIAAKSAAIRRFCMDRDFDTRTYTQLYPVALDGTVRLYQVPVNQVLRVQGQPATALTVSNPSTAIQSPQVYFSYTGQADGYGTNTQTPNGLNLVWVTSGIPSTINVPFTIGMTVSDLAAAVVAVGSGWTATADATLGFWPVTELTGGYTGQGANLATAGATFSVLTDLPNCMLINQSTGFLLVGRQYNGLGGRWGPDWTSWNDGCGPLNQVKVTYSAGFTTIPPDVQLSLAETCKDEILRMRMNPYLESERAGEYSYKLSLMSQWQDLSPTVQQRLSRYRLHYS